MFNLEHEKMIKEDFISNLSQSIKSCNAVCDRSILSLLVGYKKGLLTQDEALDVLTEIRDRVFDNQRELEQCI